jgi:DNA-binding transcriptional MerR regulator
VADGHLSIGAFSRASLLSIKALRAYHAAGILEPAVVDPRTGYRSYSPSQLTDAAVVRRLRSLDLPLDRVREVVAARDPEVTRRVLAAHAAVMRARLEDVTRIVGELQSGVDLPAAHTPVHVRDVPGSATLAVRGVVREAELPSFLGQAYGSLAGALVAAGVAPSGPSGALYPGEIPTEAMEVEAFLPVASSVDPLPGPAVVASSLSPARAAVAVHAGPYDTIDATYRQLGAWVAEHAVPAPGAPVREVYVVSWDETTDPARFRTEIQWPVA